MITTKLKQLCVIPLFRLLGLKHEKLDRPSLNLSAFIYDRFKASSITFVQVGANDGSKNDSLQLFRKRYDWKGLMIEANPLVFKKLSCAHCTDSNIRLFNCAIGTATAQLPFYRVDSKFQMPDYEQYLDQISSFDREHVVKQLTKMTIDAATIDKIIEVINVDTYTLNDFLKSNGVAKVNLLFVDTEGYDWKIVSQLETIAEKPDLIIFECEHLTQNEIMEIPAVLTKWGYAFYRIQGDVVCAKWDC